MPAHFPRHAILLALSLTTINFPAAAQDASPAPAPSTTSATADDAYQAQRKFAMALLNQQKHIEALPVFESLAKQNPNDADVLFGWGACLINHSATVSDPNAAKTERIHARQLLIRAKELGNKSALLANLLDLVPEDGSVGFSSASETDAAMRAGESAFAKNDYDEAIKHYSHALELDPKNYHAALFVGDSYFAQKDFPNAVVWYDRAIALDSNIETAYRYEADLYVKSGEMEKARTRSIQAVVANPYSQITKFRVVLSARMTSTLTSLLAPKSRLAASTRHGPLTAFPAPTGWATTSKRISPKLLGIAIRCWKNPTL